MTIIVYDCEEGRGEINRFHRFRDGLLDVLHQ